jgi:hypothetical protein
VFYLPKECGEADGYFVVEVRDYAVYSVGADNPRDGGRWIARGLQPSAIRYVARRRKRAAAMAMLRKVAEESANV